MPRNMSFMMTTNQYCNGTKDVTRRLGWWFVKTGDLQNGVKKSQGLRKGEKVIVLGQHIIVSTRAEPLNRMTDDLQYGARECEREGFPDLSPMQFVKLFCDSHRNCSPTTIVNRIEFTTMNMF